MGNVGPNASFSFEGPTGEMGPLAFGTKIQASNNLTEGGTIDVLENLWSSHWIDRYVLWVVKFFLKICITYHNYLIKLPNGPIIGLCDLTDGNNNNNLQNFD